MSVALQICDEFALVDVVLRHMRRASSISGSLTSECVHIRATLSESICPNLSSICVNNLKVELSFFTRPMSVTTQTA